MSNDFENDHEVSEPAFGNPEETFVPESQPRSPWRFLKFSLPFILGSLLAMILAVAIIYIPMVIVLFIGGALTGLACGGPMGAACRDCGIENKVFPALGAILAALLAAYVFLGTFFWQAVSLSVKEEKKAPQIQVEPGTFTRETLVLPVERDGEMLLVPMQEMEGRELYEAELAWRVSFDQSGISLPKALASPRWVYYYVYDCLTDPDTREAWVYYMIMLVILPIVAAATTQEAPAGQAVVVHATGPASRIDPSKKP